jgi:hypothetical protein
MGVPTSDVGYIIATTRRKTTKVHKNVWWHWEKKIKAGVIVFMYIMGIKIF